MLVEKRMSPGIEDAHGFLLDAFVAVVLALLTRPLLARTRWASVALPAWGALVYASYEFTRTMNALPPWQSIRYLGDATFLGGSAVVVSRPVLLALFLAAPLTAGFWIASWKPARLLPLVSGGAALGVAAFAWPVNPAALAWRQTNVVAGNAADIVSSTRTVDLPPLGREEQVTLDRLFTADLGGADVVPALRGKPNVLLILLEGIAGTDLPTVAERHGHPGWSSMPELDAIGRKNIYLHTFITHQRGTNRGLYSSLCGDYPKLSAETAKMTEKAGGPDLDCLPAVLRRSGYETVYLQAAPLGFMLKDSFMPRAGFSQTLGGEQLSGGYARSNWGVDDRAFFERTRQKVRELRAGTSPG